MTAHVSVSKVPPLGRTEKGMTKASWAWRNLSSYIPRSCFFAIFTLRLLTESSNTTETLNAVCPFHGRRWNGGFIYMTMLWKHCSSWWTGHTARENNWFRLQDPAEANLHRAEKHLMEESCQTCREQSEWQDKIRTSVHAHLKRAKKVVHVMLSV